MAYLAARAANPKAVVALPGLTYWWDVDRQQSQYLERLLSALASDSTAVSNSFYFDAAVLHLYNEPEGLLRAPILFKALMAQRGLDKPIWINETNVAPWNDPINPMPRGDFRATLEEQASFVIQAYAWGLLSGAERISVYPMADGDLPRGWEQMGLIRKDGSERPAYRALQTVTRYLNGAQPVGIERAVDHVRLRFERPGSVITCLWATGPQPVLTTVPATFSTATLVDRSGGKRQLWAQDGLFWIALSGATANTVPRDSARFLIGGEPFLLVEGAAPPRAVLGSSR